MKIKTEVLAGESLDWAYALATGVPAHEIQVPVPPVAISDSAYQAGIEVVRCNDLHFPQGNENGDYKEPYYMAKVGDLKIYGPSATIATKRCFVLLQVGSEVDIPEALTAKEAPQEPKRRPAHRP